MIQSKEHPIQSDNWTQKTLQLLGCPQTLTKEDAASIVNELEGRLYQMLTDSSLESLTLCLTKCLFRTISEPTKETLAVQPLLQKAIELSIRRVDPSMRLVKQLSRPIAIDYEEGTVLHDKLLAFVRILTRLFENQTPLNRDMNSFIYMYGGDGILLREPLKFPFQKHPFEEGGTFCCWMLCEKQQHESKLLSLLNKERVGFQLVIRGEKVYYQRLEGESKSWIKTKPAQAYLCDMPLNRPVSLSIEFEIRKKMFLKPYFVINLYLNDITVNNIEIEMPHFNCRDFSMELLKNFNGCVSSVMLLSKNLAGLIEQNNIRGFMFENQLRNFTFLCQRLLKHVVFLYTPIRAAVNSLQELDLFDVYGRNCAHISAGQGGLYQNRAIKKELINYGGLSCYLSILHLIEEVKDMSPRLLNQYLSLLTNIFLNKSGAQEEASNLKAFAIIKNYLIRTSMKYVDEQTIYQMKELYVALSNKLIRQEYLKTLVWGLHPIEHLSDSLFDQFITLIKSFYTQDIQTTMAVSGLREIINFIMDYVEGSSTGCCTLHGQFQNSSVKNYRLRLSKYFSLIENIMMLKRNDAELPTMVVQTIQMFTLKMSGCLCEVLLDFIDDVSQKDSRIEYEFSLQFAPVETKLLVYNLLANMSSICCKARILKMILKLYGDELVARERVAAYELCACLKTADQNQIRNSVHSHEQKISMDSQDKSSEPKSTSLADLVRGLKLDRENDSFGLMEESTIIDVVLEWSYKPRPQEQCNNGLLLLSDLYFVSNSACRKRIWEEVALRHEQTRMDPDLLLWLTEALLSEMLKPESSQDSQLTEMILEIIVMYECELILREDDSNENALITSSIIQTVFSSRFAKEKKEYQLISYMYIVEAIMRKFKELTWSPGSLPDEGRIVINSMHKHLTQYFLMSSFDGESSFDESQSQDMRLQTLPLEILSHFLTILQKIAGDRLLQEQSASSNQKFLSILFQHGFELQSGDQEHRPSLMCMVFVMLQAAFDELGELEMEAKVGCIQLIEGYLLLMMQMSQNSGTLPIKIYEQELSTTFQNVMSFLEIKFYQYFHFQVTGKMDFMLQTKLRSNTMQIKDRILQSFIKVLELMKTTEEVSSREHRSFYQLMRRNKSSSRFKLNNLYPRLMRDIDDRIIQFYYIDDIGKMAGEKLEAALLQRKISRYSSAIERAITKKMEAFLAIQKKAMALFVDGSLSKFYDSQKDKYRVVSQFEEQLNLLRIDSESRQRSAAIRRLQSSQKHRREVIKSQNRIWEQSRLFQGLWAHPEFYSFSQKDDTGMEHRHELLKTYTRARSSVQTRLNTQPFLKIKVRREHCPLQESFPEELFPNQNSAPTRPRMDQAKKSERYLKLGLQFLKKKFIDRIMRPSQQKIPAIEEFIFSDVLWNHRFTLWNGDIKINRDRLEFTYKQPGDHSHLTLFRFALRDDQELVRHWKLSDIESLTFIKFLLRSNSVELQLCSGKSLLFTFFNDHNKAIQFAECLLKLKKSQQPDLNPQSFPTRPQIPTKIFEKSDSTRRWLAGDMSNFDYIMCLNVMSGRSLTDLNQYPVFPWVRGQYDNTRDIDRNWRDLSRSMGCLGSEERRQRFKKVFESTEHFGPTQVQQQFHYGFHYSNLPIVLQYLIRCNPYTQACKMLQGGKFDVPDRLFSSLSDSYQNATREMSDVRELIPEFYYFPEFLINMEDNNFGVQQCNRRVHHVELPEGYSTAFEFIESHREALEGEYVTENIHKWIDLIFGYKNTGKEADANMNRYFYLTYEDNAEMIQAQQQDKKSVESQMAFYGKTPSQLLAKPHPQKKWKKQRPLNLCKSRRTNLFGEEAPKTSLLVRYHDKHFFSKSPTSAVLFSFSQTADKYTIVRRDGNGRVFSLDHDKDSSGSLIDRQFHWPFDRFEYSYCLDERGVFNQLPIVCIQAECILLGGVWGGRILCYDILTSKVEAYSKHSDTVTALTHCESSRLVASGSLNGEVIIWEYSSKHKILYRSKCVNHQGRVNHLHIDYSLRLLISAGQDGLVVLTNIYTAKMMHILKFEESVSWALSITYPMTMVVLQTGSRQLCYSINGQYLDEAAIDIMLKPQILRTSGTRERLCVKMEKEFAFLSLPDFSAQSKYTPNKESDQQLSHYLARNGSILFMAEDKLVYAYEPEEEETS